MKYITLFISILLIGIVSCKEDKYDVGDIELGKEYYPLEVGKYWVYQVDSTTFKPGASATIVNSSTTYVREEIIGLTENNIGDTIYILERFEKQALADEWELRDVWQTSISGNRAEKTEENIKLVKMLFPLTAGSNFDASIYIDSETEIIVVGESLAPFRNWNAEVQTVNEPANIGTFSFPEVSTIQYANDENLLERRFASAQFAKGVGLVSANEEILDTQCLAECADDAWIDKAEKGYTMVQTLLEHN